jgi:hypothetical protein
MSHAFLFSSMPYTHLTQLFFLHFIIIIEFGYDDVGEDDDDDDDEDEDTQY